MVSRNCICVEKGDSFEIQINKIDRNDPETYACELYVDGEHLNQKKTFDHRTMYYGFKQGQGAYTEFLFTSPKLWTEEEDKNQKKSLLDR